MTTQKYNLYCDTDIVERGLTEDRYLNRVNELVTARPDCVLTVFNAKGGEAYAYFDGRRQDA